MTKRSIVDAVTRGRDNICCYFDEGELQIFLDRIGLGKTQRHHEHEHEHEHEHVQKQQRSLHQQHYFDLASNLRATKYVLRLQSSLESVMGAIGFSSVVASRRVVRELDKWVDNILPNTDTFESALERCVRADTVTLDGMLYHLGFRQDVLDKAMECQNGLAGLCMLRDDQIKDMFGLRMPLERACLRMALGVLNTAFEFDFEQEGEMIREQEVNFQTVPASVPETEADDNQNIKNNYVVQEMKTKNLTRDASHARKAWNDESSSQEASERDEDNFTAANILRNINEVPITPSPTLRTSNSLGVIDIRIEVDDLRADNTEIGNNFDANHFQLVETEEQAKPKQSKLTQVSETRVTGANSKATKPTAQIRREATALMGDVGQKLRTCMHETVNAHKRNRGIDNFQTTEDTLRQQAEIIRQLAGALAEAKLTSRLQVDVTRLNQYTKRVRGVVKELNSSVCFVEQHADSA